MFKNQSFLTSIKIAVLGLKSAFKEERNFRIQFLIAVIVSLLMVVFKLNSIEISILILTMLVVLSLELINSQIEKFLDLIQPEHHPRVKIIKDFSAGAVLLSVIGSVVIGLLIFWPYLIKFF
jgi:diacylglycerol kinase